MRLAIVINEFLSAPTAHMIYIARLAAHLALARPQAEVHLLFPRSREKFSFEAHGLPCPANLHLHPLFALRKRKKGLGLNLNAIFYRSALTRLKKLQPEIVFSASFPKLWRFLLKHRKALPHSRFVYELHELVELGSRPTPARIAEEVALLKQTDRLFTTTEFLRSRLAAHGLEAARLPLGCAYNPDDFAPAGAPHAPFRLGYLGSTYAGQGIDWLAKNWLGEWGELWIVGGEIAEKALGVSIHPRVKGSTEIREKFLSQVDALVIPPLPVGRMPFVPFTKAYDYLAFRRPIIAADFPSIAEVLREGQEALLFKAGDLNSFAAALKRLQADAALGQKLAVNTAARAREFSWENRAEGFWQAVESRYGCHSRRLTESEKIC